MKLGTDKDIVMIGIDYKTADGTTTGSLLYSGRLNGNGETYERYLDKSILDTVRALIAEDAPKKEEESGDN